MPPLVLLLVPLVTPSDDRPDVPLADFESPDYGDWVVTGTAFGDGPTAGTLPGQMAVDGFHGKRLVNSYRGGDGSVGTLTSPPFTVDRPHLNFLIGGGGYAGETELQLLVGGAIVRTATGPNRKPGGSERLSPASWDLTELAGKTARVRVVDARRGGWGHLNVDHLVLSDTAVQSPPPPVALAQTLTVNGSHLLVPVSNREAGDGRTQLGLYDGERLVQSFDVTLPAGGDPAWWAAYPLAPFAAAGETLTLRPTRGTAPAAVAAAFGEVRVGSRDEVLSAEDFTRPYRNRFHLASRRGWNNDPNGLVYHDGLWHVFYQHNPFGIFWGNMHWGHSTSPDLVNWTERPIALFQNTPRDAMFSGGGFVDHNNSSGLGAGTLFTAFTSTGRGECLAHSTDGGLTFTELAENPVVKHTGRDPKVFYHQPSARWVMAVYEQEETAETRATPPSAAGAKRPHAQIAFYNSEDLRHWERAGAFTDPDRDAVYECPELFELSVIGGEDGETRWVLYGAQNRYVIGHFDGRAFTKQSGPHGDSHGAFYAAQTFENTPGGRRIQMGWVRTEDYINRFPDQTVNQCLSLPHELTLHATPDGPRLRFDPVGELDALRVETLADVRDLTAAEADRELAAAAGRLSEVRIEFEAAGRHELTINGVDAGFAGTSAVIFTDRTVTELYIDGGRRYEVRTRPDAAFDENTSGLRGDDPVASLKIHALRSIWPH